jgi:outer membrane protein assembly factor BamB
MKRTALALISFAASCGGSTPTQPAGNNAPPEIAKPPVAHEEDKGPEGENILAEVLKMNGPDYGSPPDKFRVGHVSTRQSPPVTRTPNGFEIRFGSKAPIVTPAVYNGKVYVSGGFRSKEMYAFEATTGKPAWAINLDDDGPSSTACADGVCVFNTESCTVFAVDAASGEHLWSYWLGDPLTSSPTIAGGKVFTSYPAAGVSGGKPRPPGASHALAAFDLRTGKILWQKWLDSDVMSAPVAQNKFVYVATFGGTVMKLEQATGNIRYAIRVRATSAPVVQFDGSGRESMYYTRRGEAEKAGAEEMIIRADDNSPKTRYKAGAKKADYIDEKAQESAAYADEGEANDSANGFGGGAPASANPMAAKGNIGQASVHTMQAFQGSRILHIGDRNVNTMGDEVVATSAETGAELWRYKLTGDLRKEGGFLGTAPLYAGKSVLLATLEGNVVQLDPRTGKNQGSWKVGARVRSQPVVHDGWIYVGTEDGRLIAINTGKREITGWPMWGGNAARTGIQAAR